MKTIKKYHLKKEVKETLLVSLVILVLVVGAKISSQLDKNAIETCMNNGHEYSYCVAGV